MAKRVTTGASRELVGAVRTRFGGSSRVAKGRILDEFVAVTGYHRKHAIRLLASPERDHRPAAERERVYTPAVRDIVVVLWEVSDRICGKRLKAIIPTLFVALERHGHMEIAPDVRQLVLQASAATIDRLLKDARAGGKGGRRRSTLTSAVRRTIPVRTFADWNDPLPGFMEADLVAHSGPSASGSFVQTLVLTDVASSWTECVPLVVREQVLVTEAMSAVRARLPFPLLGFDTDNDSVFMNETVADYCTAAGISLTRSRPYRKNDQAFVEQKNGSIVRRLVGYGRLEGLESVRLLQRLYAASRLFGNLFQPSFKLLSKAREGARVKKRYHAPRTPCDQLLANAAIAAETKEALKRTCDETDPLALLKVIREVQGAIASLAGQPDVRPSDDEGSSDLDAFLQSFATAWTQGEVRATHRAPPTEPRSWRTRVDPFAATWRMIEDWLEAEPDRTSRELLLRLQAEHPDVDLSGQLRTLQRRVRTWRGKRARDLLLGTVEVAAVPTAAAPPASA